MPDATSLAPRAFEQAFAVVTTYKSGILCLPQDSVIADNSHLRGAYLAIDYFFHNNLSQEGSRDYCS